MRPPPKAFVSKIKASTSLPSVASATIWALMLAEFKPSYAARSRQAGSNANTPSTITPAMTAAGLHARKLRRIREWRAPPTQARQQDSPEVKPDDEAVKQEITRTG